MIGSFNINDYLNRLYEESESKSNISKTTSSVEGIIIPEENKKSFDWLKKEYQKGRTEVKVEINMGGSNFKPALDLETNLKSVKDFKPGMFGDVKTSDTEGSKKKEDGIKDGNKDGQKPVEGKGFTKFGSKSGIKGEVKTKKGVSVKDGEAEEKEEKEDKYKNKK